MFTLGALGFAAPALLLALVALPVLWWLLRAMPPAPAVRRFPGVALLLGLRDEEVQTHRTPWWLLLMRMLAVAALIVGFAGPVLNPRAEAPGTAPLLIVADASWASARDWQRREERIAGLLADAARTGRSVAIVTLSDPPPQGPVFRAADHWSDRLSGIAPAAWEPDAQAMEALAAALPDQETETYWLSDGLEREGREALLEALEARGPVTVFESPAPVYALHPPRFEEGLIQLTASRVGAAEDIGAEVTITGHGPDPSGVERELARGTASFEPGEQSASVSFSLQPELRNRITRFQIEGQRSAGALSLTDDALQRRKVALLAPREGREGLELLAPLHYLRQALDPVADLIEGSLEDMLLSNPDVIVFADVAQLADLQADMLTEWMEDGGLLLRFAGPRLAASDVGRGEPGPLMPVRLRAGGRTVGGAMSWGEPRALRPFASDSPFAGLDVPEDVTVSAQVLAQPDPELSQRTIAALADGTPLVTRQHVGQGQVVLFHVTANADWSTLPISGLFVQMLERLAVSTRPAPPTAEELAGSTWVAERVIDGFGTPGDPERLGGVAGEALAEGRVSKSLPPGVYGSDERRIALNVTGPERELAASTWPARVNVEGVQGARETMLKGAFLGAAVLLLLADVIASLWITGRMRATGMGRAARTAALAGAAMVAGVGLLVGGAGSALAEGPSDDRLAIQATSEVVLAHVITGDPRIDEVAEAGLRGLSRRLYERTSVEPAEPIGINLENDELAFFPMIYWPITEDQPQPSDAAYAKLNRYLRSGGMILFDTRDADIAEFGFSSPTGRRLQELARPLDVPPLEPVPEDHVLSRTFYLLQDYPGRHNGDVWVEAAPPDAEQAEGMPFRNLNDGVTPVVIGGNDWASAWAVNASGQPMITIGRGQGGARQREIAYRFGINLVMHVLTGNYKSDQVHVPALLERLGQ